MADEKIVTSIVANSDFSNLIADVQRVTNSLHRLQQEFAGSNRALAGQIDAANAMFNQTMLKTGQFSSHFVSLTSDVEKFGRNLDSGRLKLKDYFRVYQDHIRTSGGLVRDLAKQQVQLQNAVLQPLGRNAQGLMQYNVHIPRGLDLTKNKTALLKQELQIMNKVIQDGGVQLINWGKNTQWAGRQLTVGLTLPLVAFGKAAADAFKVADQELTRLTKVYGDVAGTSAQELAKVRKDVAATAKELSAAMGVNFAETIGLAADIAATGKTGNELLSSISETTRLAVLGEVDRQEAMKATLAIQSAFKANTEELAESINFLNAVENQTSTTLNDLVEAIPKAGPVIKGLGGSVEDLALYMTAMREGGINASEGANALKSALASLINPTDKAVEKFQAFGIDLLGIVQKNAGSTTDTLFALQAALDRLNPLQKQQAIEQLFGKFQYSRLNALFENLGRQGSQTLQVLDLMKASASELEAVAGRELAAVTESAAGRYKRAIESLKADLAGVGDQFLDIATKLVNVLNKVLDFGQKLPDPIKKIMAFGGAFTAIIGPVIMLTGVLANFFGYIIKGLGHFKALFKGAEGFRLLTPEIIAARNASSMLSDEFYSDAKAAETLRFAIEKLNNDLRDLQVNATKATSATSGLGQMLITSAGTPIMPIGGLGGPRSVIKEHPLLGSESRAAAHLNPRNPKDPATLFGLTLQPIPLNRRIGRTPQVLMSERLPDIEGITSVGGISTGVVAGEHARYAALMATLGMQSKQEIEALKKTIGLGGQVSQEFIATFDDILPMTQRLTANAAAQSAAIVADLRAGKITAEAALARIFAANAELERMLGVEVTAYAVSRGRSIDLTKAPLIDQPVVDIAGKPNTRGMFRTGIFRDVMDAVGRATRTRTYGGPYSIETTRRLNKGGEVPGYINGDYVYMTNGETVPGPNVNADVVPAMLTPGEFVLTRDVVEQQGSDAVEALHRGEAAIVPFGANKGGRVPGVQYLNTAGSVLARAMGAAQTKRRTSTAELYAQRVQMGPEASRYYYNPFGRSGQGQHEDRAHAFYSVREAAAKGYRPPVGYFGVASVNKYNQIQHRLSTRLGTRDVNPLTDATAVAETIPDIFTRGGAGNWFAKNGLIDDGVADAYQIRAFLNHVEDFARTKKWDTKKFGPPPLGFLGLNDPSSSVKVSELRDYVEYLMSGKVTGINKHGIILNDAEALMSTGRYTQEQALDEAERIYLRAMSEGDNDWSYRDKRMDITETEYPFMIERKNKGGKIYGFNRGGMVPGYQNGGGVSRAGLLARLGAKFNYQGKKYDGFDALQTYKINAMDINGGRKYFGDIPGLSDKGRGALYNSTLEFFNSSMIKGDRIDGKRQFVPRHFLTAMPTIAANAITWNKGWLSPEDLLVLEQIKGKGASLGGSASSAMHLKNVYKDVFMANRGGMVPGYRRGGGVVGRNRIFYGDNIDYSRTPFAMMQAGLIPFPGQQSRSGIQTQQAMPMMPGMGMPGMGAWLGMQAASVGGMFTGQALGNRFGSGAGMAGSIIGSMLPMMFMGGMGRGKDISALYDKSILSGTKFGQSMAGQAMQGGKLSSTLGRLALGLTKFNVAIAAVTVVAGLGYKAWQNYQEGLERLRNTSGLTEESAKKLGLRYKNFAAELSTTIKVANQWIDSNRAIYEGMQKADAPFRMTVAEYKKLRKEVKGTMQDQIELVNKTKAEDLAQVATQMKAMFVAAGMSAEEAARKIYMVISLSNKASQAYTSTIGNQGFASIVNTETATNAAIKYLNTLVGDKGSDAEAQLRAFNTAMQGIVRTTEEAVDVERKRAEKKKEDFDESKVKLEKEKELLDKLAKTDLSPIGESLYNQLVAADPVLASVISKADNLRTIMQKMSLIKIGLDPDLLLSFTGKELDTVYDTAIKVQLDVEAASKKNLAAQYDEIEALKEKIEIQERAAKGEKVQTQINRRDRIKALEEEIKAINEAADARRQALQEEAEDQDINAEIQKKRLDYQQKLAAGDLGGAAQAQIDLQQAINRQQRTITERQIEERRAADVAPLQAEIDKLNKAAQDQADAAALAGEDLNRLRDRLGKLQTNIENFNSSLTKYLLDKAFNGGENLDILSEAAIRAAEKLGLTSDQIEKILKPRQKPEPTTLEGVERKYVKGEGQGKTIDIAGVEDDSYDTGIRGKRVNEVGAPKYKNRKEAMDNLGKTHQGANNVGYTLVQNDDGKPVWAQRKYFNGQWTILKEYPAYAGGGYLRGFSDGTTDGPVSGPGSWTSDSILARLSNGEFVHRSAAVHDAGIDNMHLINQKGSAGIVEAAMDIISENSGMLPKFNNGGLASGPTRAARALLGSLSALFPKRNRASDGIMPSAAHMVQNPRSDHNKGLAVDITHDPANGVDAGKLFYSLRKDPRTSYLIFNKKIWNRSIDDKDGAGRRYTGSNPHTAHIHVSILGSMGAIGEAWLGAPHDMAMRNQGFSSGQSKPEGLQLGENYIVKPGDSLSEIARRAGISLAKLLQANPNIANDPRYMGGSRIFGGTKVNIPGFHKGGSVHAHPHLTTPTNYKKPGVPYTRSGRPIGNPFGMYWGELSRFIGPRVPGMDIWGGTEIPGLKFTGKIPQMSDYWHQMQEQPRKITGGGGLGSVTIPIDSPLYGGSGASGGFGGGSGGFGIFHSYAGGGSVKRTRPSALEFIKFLIERYSETKPENFWKPTGGGMLPIMPGLGAGGGDLGLKLYHAGGPVTSLDQVPFTFKNPFTSKTGKTKTKGSGAGQNKLPLSQIGGTGKAVQDYSPYGYIDMGDEYSAGGTDQKRLPKGSAVRSVQDYVHALMAIANTYYGAKYQKLFKRLGVTNLKTSGADVLGLMNPVDVAENSGVAFTKPIDAESSRNIVLNPYSILADATGFLPGVNTKGMTTQANEDGSFTIGRMGDFYFSPGDINKLDAKEYEKWIASNTFNTPRGKMNLIMVAFHEFAHGFMSKVQAAIRDKISNLTKNKFIYPESIVPDWKESLGLKYNHEYMADDFAGAMFDELSSKGFITGISKEYINYLKNFATKNKNADPGGFSSAGHPFNWDFRAKTFAENLLPTDKDTTTSIIARMLDLSGINNLAGKKLVPKSLMEDPNAATNLIKNIMSGKAKGSSFYTRVEDISFHGEPLSYAEYTDEFGIPAGRILGTKTPGWFTSLFHSIAGFIETNKQHQNEWGRPISIPKKAMGGYINPTYSANMSIPSYKTGVTYLYNDTIAELHKKEAVLPENMNPWNPTATNPIGGDINIHQPITINASPDMDIDMLVNKVATKVEAATSRALIKAGRDRAI